MWQQLESKKCIGQSRHEAKLEAKQKDKKVDGIYSYKTYDAYKQSSKTFTKWIKSEYPQIKNISEIDKNICALYIQYRAKKGVSPYTYSQDMAMLNKILNVNITKEYCGVARRSLNNITKNRIDNGYRTNTGKIETIIKGSGLRRNELINLKVKDLIINNKSVVGILVNKGAKGGKTRKVEIRKEYQVLIYKLIENFDINSHVITEQIPKQLQTHRLRAEYAQNMIFEFISLNREDPYKDLTQSMGHNRKSILIYYGVKQKQKPF